jgi:tetratricopeptide (TPR) repeat protein
MARKRSGGNKGKGSGGRGRPRPPEGPLSLPDRRVIEGVLRQAIGGQGEETPAQRAQDLIYQAVEFPDPRQRAAVARQALELWPDCADAYVLLAENAADRKETLHLYEQGVAAGERALGPQAFQEYVGHFWGFLETRPYMRARSGLANHLWMMGRRDEAVAHLRDMLRLNPGDNQGNRYVLAGWLAVLERNDELTTLLDQYNEASAMWLWMRALVAFRREGDTPASRKALKAAIKANKHIVNYVAGHKMPPAEGPGSYSPGQESEALVYVQEALPAWKETPGAADWVRSVNAPARKGRRGEAERPESLTPEEAVRQLRELPQQEETWLADARQLPLWVGEEGRPVRPWMVAVVRRQMQEGALAHEIIPAAPTAATVLNALVLAARSETLGTPHRPRELHVPAGVLWEELRPHLEQAGIPMLQTQDPQEADSLFAFVAERLGSQGGPPALAGTAGISVELMADYYDAAASFFERSPWRSVGYEAAIHIEVPRLQGGPWYGVLMGQSGLMSGLALYHDLALLRRLLRGELSDEQNARLTVADVVSYGEDFTLAFADLDAIQEHGWRIARGDAYPCGYHKGRNREMRSATAPELELLVACLRTVPDFIQRRKQDDHTPETFEPTVAGTPTPVTLVWVTD